MPVLDLPPDSGSGSCGLWPVDLGCYDGIPDDVDPALIEQWQAVATGWLWAAGGRRHGLCSRTVRPCLRSCADEFGIPWQAGQLMPYILDGEWYNASPCGCVRDCSCTELCEVFLPGPVHAITEVRIDGAELDPADYRVDAPGWLVRQNGECWPRCQAMNLPMGEDGTFTVTYDYGLALTAHDLAAVSELTAELIKRCIPGCDCRLTDVDLETAAEGGLTGLPFVDAWILTVNPNRLPAQPRVMSPDSGWLTPRQQIWP